MITPVKISVAKRMIISIMQAGLVPFLTGSPGIGKSSIFHEIAAMGNLEIIDLRLSQCDPTDINGFPDLKGNKATYVPMDTLPLVGDAIPLGKVGWMLLLDEFNSASPSVQAASYKLVLDRMVGNHHLHDKVFICCAGNLETDNAIVNPMSTALQSRLIHIQMETNMDDWLVWAMDNKVDHRITSYLQFAPKNFYSFTPDHTDSTYACPRTWVFANKLLQKVTMDSDIIRPLLNGTLSTHVTSEFLAFCNIYKELPSLKDLESSPETVSIPTSPSTLFAITGFIATHATDKNMASLAKYISRMPMEFQIVCWREMQQRNPDTCRNPVYQQWAVKNIRELY
jgi:hypothetical protein